MKRYRIRKGSFLDELRIGIIGVAFGFMLFTISGALLV